MPITSPSERSHLFVRGMFTLHSGAQSSWKIECDAIAEEEWHALARMAVERLEPFCMVVGIPRGGIPFAEALDRYTDHMSDTILIVDDVWTTGTSMEEARRSVTRDFTLVDHDIRGVVAFARVRPHASWVTPLFTMAPEMR